MEQAVTPDIPMWLSKYRTKPFTTHKWFVKKLITKPLNWIILWNDAGNV
jgi:hypothetical protein